MRLITLDQDVDFVGRLQVMHNGEWGNVCGDSFDDEEADVACWSLNYTRGAVSHTTRPFLETPGLWQTTTQNGSGSFTSIVWQPLYRLKL